MNSPHSSPTPTWQTLLETGQARAVNGDLAGAETTFNSVAQNTTFPDEARCQAWLGLSQLYQGTGRFRDMAHVLSEILQRHPSMLPLRANRALALSKDGQHEAAKQDAAQVLGSNQALEPPIYYTCGTVLEAANAPKDAIIAYESAIAGAPDLWQAHYNTGNILSHLGLHEEAIGALERAKVINPQDPQIPNNIAHSLMQSGKHEQAWPHIEKALALAPEHTDTLINAGLCLQKRPDLHQAHDYFTRAIHTAPSRHDVHLNAGTNALLMGHHAQAYTHFCDAHKADPTNGLAHSNVASAATLHPGLHENQVAEIHRQHPAAKIKVAPLTTKQRCGPLRIGYLSPDFRGHAVSHFFEPLLTHHDKGAFDITLFHDSTKSDTTTARLKTMAHAWHDVSRLPDQALATCIQSAELDILIELTGHTAANRLGLFHHRLVPVQISYLGYPNTTGCPEMDVFISDDFVNTPQQDPHYSERVERLKRPFYCYRLPDFIPDVNALPADTCQTITFGSLHSLAKTNATAFALWAEVLKAVPNSRLMLCRDNLTGDLATDLITRFENMDINPERIIIKHTPPQPNVHFSYYHDIDIALDTYPWTGHTTTVEAIAMGVPVITKCGETRAQRMAAGVLHAIGRHDWITRCDREYVSTAKSLAEETNTLRLVRAVLRDELMRSPIGDAEGFARDFEALLTAQTKRA